MIKKIAKLTLFVLFLIGIAVLFEYQPLNLKQKLPEIEKNIADNIANSIEKQFSAPPPLVAEKQAPQSYLTVKGVFKWTNTARAENGALPALTENSKLDLIANERLKDMFAKQYFEHINPQGVGAADIAGNVGYQYILIGENLALGNFKDDQTVVDAWMNSPGHRANILNNRYTEIGIAVSKGNYKGEETWIAVQIFGLPLSACPQPDQSLKAQIDSYKNQISQLENSAAILKNQIESMDPKTRDEVKNYNQMVNDYNAMINQINSLINKTKSLISQYNSQVEILNNCIKG